MGTVYMILSIALFLTETVLQIYIVSESSNNSEWLFICLLAFVMGPLILVNFISALQVTRTQDFTGKRCGRILCIVFHSFQFGMVWRSLKLVILYDLRDWLEYLSLRLVHCGFQSIPFTIILTFTMFSGNSASAVQVLTSLVSMVSAALTFAMYGLGEKVYDSDEFSKTSEKVRKTIGVVFLICSSFLLLMSRCASIVLFSVVEPRWFALPIILQFVVHVVSSLILLARKRKLNCVNLTKKVYLSFISLFDMVNKGFTGVRCKYVLYYTVILVQNIIMSAWWMLSADNPEMFKLMTVVIVLMGFIIGIILKFASCGCVYQDSPDLLGDAFNSPIPPKHMDKGTCVPNFDAETCSPPTSPKILSPRPSPSPITIADSGISNMNKNTSSKQGSVSSSQKAKRQYDNQGYVWDKSTEALSPNNLLMPKETPQSFKKEKVLVHVNPKARPRPTRDKASRHRNNRLKRVNDSNNDLASSNSRNTNTLNISSQSMYNTGFDDPFRERKMLQANLNAHLNPYNNARRGTPRVNRLRDLSLVSGLTSLDSSELYPSITSDSSSMTSYEHPRHRHFHQKQSRTSHRPHFKYESQDGYSTDVSNSEYLSYNDYSVDDSSDWTSESSSESDSAVTWPPSNIGNILGLPEEKVSSKDSVSHWLDTIDAGESVVSDQRSVQDFSCAEESDTGTAMQRFEIQPKRRKGKIKKFLPEPKGVFLKFCSLNYKTSHKQYPNRPFPAANKDNVTYSQKPESVPIDPSQQTTLKSSVKLQVNNVQESIV